MFDVEYGVFNKIVHLTPYKTLIFDYSWERVTKTKDLSAQSLTITSKVGFQTMFLYKHWVNQSQVIKRIFIVKHINLGMH